MEVKYDSKCRTPPGQFQRGGYAATENVDRSIFHHKTTISIPESLWQSQFVMETPAYSAVVVDTLSRARRKLQTISQKLWCEQNQKHDSIFSRVFTTLFMRNEYRILDGGINLRRTY
jgi:hypothetical protein